MKQWLVIALKEVRDNLRDKRAFFFAIVFGPILLPLMVVGPMLLGAKTGIIDFDTTTEFYVEGANRAPNLIAFLRSKNLIAVAAPDNFKSLIREGELNSVLVVPENYGERLREGKPEALFLYANYSNKKSEKSARHLSAIVDGYSRHLGFWRLQARGIDYELTTPIKLVKQDLSNEGVGGMVFGFLVYFILIFTMMTGGFYLAVDITAGERERNSLEPLLALPITRYTIVVGKYMATLGFVCFSASLSLLSLYAVFTFLPLDKLENLLKLDGDALLRSFLLALPCAFLVSSLLMATAAFTKSAKEAQTYISLLFLLPTIPLFLGQFVDVKTQFGSMLVPFFSQSTLIDKMIKGEIIQPLWVIASVSGALLMAVVLFFVTIRLYKHEKILSH